MRTGGGEYPMAPAQVPPYSADRYDQIQMSSVSAETGQLPLCGRLPALRQATGRKSYKQAHGRAAENERDVRPSVSLPTVQVDRPVSGKLNGYSRSGRRRRFVEKPGMGFG